VYLHGLLVRPAGGLQVGDPDFVSTDYGSFEPVCAVPGETEESVWRRFLQKIESLAGQGSIAVYIYSPAERVMLRRLKNAYGGSDALTVFEAAMIDMCKVVKRSVILPTDGDGLKTVAQHLGFEWRDPDPGGGQSITWWKQYLDDPAANASLRERVVAYNEDDVRATFAIRDWLARFSLTEKLRDNA
jgi:predicted RecB family nuclease